MNVIYDHESSISKEIIIVTTHQLKNLEDTFASYNTKFNAPINTYKKQTELEMIELRHQNEILQEKIKHMEGCAKMVASHTDMMNTIVSLLQSK
jgi:hypothetical protein